MRKVAEFLRLVDVHDGLLSLTNIALIVVILKIAFAPGASLIDLGALLVALLNYNAKKYMNKPEEKVTASSELETRVGEMQSKLNAISLSIGLKGLGK